MLPKDRFLRDKQIAENFAGMASTLAFERATDAALLQFIETLPLSYEPAEAAANRHRIEGAQLFLSTLEKIGTPSQPPPREAIGQLERV